MDLVESPLGEGDPSDPALPPAALEALVWGLLGTPHRLGLFGMRPNGELSEVHLFAGEDHRCATTWDTVGAGTLGHAGFHIFGRPLSELPEAPPDNDELLDMTLDGDRARLLWLAGRPFGAIWNFRDPTQAPVGEPALRPLHEWLASPSPDP